MSKELSKYEIREMVLQALLPLDSNTDLTKEGAAFNAIGLDHRDMTGEDESELVLAYLDTLVDDVCTKEDELDRAIEKHLKNNWHISRISRMDLVISCTAIFEMTYVTDVPTAVALDETIELAKTSSDDRSRKFVSGVLSNVLEELEAGA